MSKIYYMIGKSSTGKDTLFKRILFDETLQLKTLVSYTTRPIRDGETEGIEYFFCDEAKTKLPNKNTCVYMNVCMHVRACVFLCF